MVKNTPKALKPTATVKVLVYRCGHPTVPNGNYMEDFTVNPHHASVMSSIPVIQSWDKYRSKWSTPQIYTESIRPLRPDGKFWKSIPEYLHRDSNRRCIRRRDNSKFDFSDNNLKGF
jgi:hypothetical protein